MASREQTSNKSQDGNNTRQSKKKSKLVRSWGSDLKLIKGDRKGTDKSDALPRRRNPATRSGESSANELTLRAWKETYAKRDKFRKVI